MGNAKIKDTIKANPYLEYPIFAFGSGRCGSTLFRTLVDNHPQILCWPFEFGYYTIYKDALEYFPEPHKVSDLFKYFNKVGVFQHIGRDYDGDLGSRKYFTDSIQSDRFFDIMNTYSSERVSRKEFLQLIMYAYKKSFSTMVKPLRWFATLTLPSSESFSDFPRCKAVVLTRNPIDTYVSVKRFYFRGAEVSGRDKCSVYRPGAANRRSRWGLLETAVSPILTTFQWLDRNRDDLRVMQLFMEALRNNPEKSMRSFSNFCGIDYSSSFLHPTFLGKPHYSNLSSAKSSGGVILPQQKTEDYLKDLTEYEFYWVGKLFSRITQRSGYHNPEGIPELGGFRRIAAFLKPMQSEFPKSHEDTKWKKRKLVHILVRIARWVFAPIGYIANRYVMVNYSGQKNKVSILGK